MSGINIRVRPDPCLSEQNRRMFIRIMKRTMEGLGITVYPQDGKGHFTLCSSGNVEITEYDLLRTLGNLNFETVSS
ncbi:MAG: hypothetical protein UU80_C0001G0024 [candidate division WWE3 bacterium GW2011_GWA1_41_8]|uniref:Uncharacterized protein n=3 Tax=Katanobacteria TaxID=422282 RepID=A0A0G0XD45_UNCKA|nr:MAG: hypothetical protein UU72_C0001G0090 [candidate division WWE3 bacterium GW2011_GWB1_41_6]KKS22859.1 MAG: hypothetical protein UU80_C0001G0024 [candidate division WWE3 bacterium GW2011_GWA1_41_8]OGC56534.1 MAG: hypothetical protein A2976_02965 [candidate division WWE3 bacterium RIFCSPLOWO2_01_FULL_41_9]